MSFDSEKAMNELKEYINSKFETIEDRIKGLEDRMSRLEENRQAENKLQGGWITKL